MTENIFRTFLHWCKKGLTCNLNALSHFIKISKIKTKVPWLCGPQADRHGLFQSLIKVSWVRDPFNKCVRNHGAAAFAVQQAYISPNLVAGECLGALL